MSDEVSPPRRLQVEHTLDSMTAQLVPDPTQITPAWVQQLLDLFLFLDVISVVAVVSLTSLAASDATDLIASLVIFGAWVLVPTLGLAAGAAFFSIAGIFREMLVQATTTTATLTTTTLRLQRPTWGGARFLRLLAGRVPPADLEVPLTDVHSVSVRGLRPGMSDDDDGLHLLVDRWLDAEPLVVHAGEHTEDDLRWLAQQVSTRAVDQTPLDKATGARSELEQLRKGARRIER